MTDPNPCAWLLFPVLMGFILFASGFSCGWSYGYAKAKSEDGK